MRHSRFLRWSRTGVFDCIAAAAAAVATCFA